MSKPSGESYNWSTKDKKVKSWSKKRKHPHSPMPYWDPFSHKVDWRPK